MEKLILPLFLIAIFILAEKQQRKDLQKEVADKKKKAESSPQLIIEEYEEQFYDLCEN